MFVNCLRKREVYAEIKTKYPESINWHYRRNNSRFCLKPGLCRLWITVNVNVSAVGSNGLSGGGRVPAVDKIGVINAYI